MAESSQAKKGRQRGRQVSSRLLSLVGNGMREVGLSLVARKPRQVKSVPPGRSKPIGKVIWVVKWGGGSITFEREKKAKAFKNLLDESLTSPIDSDIIRAEITPDGYHVH